MSQDHNNNRKDERIKRGYIIKFRQIDPPVESDKWDANKPVDISRSGICFYSENRFLIGAKLQIKMSNPLLHQESLYLAIVVRVKPSVKMKMFYEIAATLEAADPEAQAAFEKAIEMFIARQHEDLR